MIAAPFTLVVPTLNEGRTLPRLVSGLDEVLSQHPTSPISELVFVDDGSTDGTVDYIAQLQSTTRAYSVRLISRTVRHGPAHAELEGIRQSANDFVLKMDADGQHSVDLLPSLWAAASTGIDIVVASRYIPGGGNNWPPLRGVISRAARFLAKLLIPGARKVEDPISGYFLVKRELALSLDANVPYYKLLLYLLATHPDARVSEVPLIMGHRDAGQSKIVGTSMKYVRDFLVELLTYWRLSRQVSVGVRSSGEKHSTKRRTRRYIPPGESSLDG